MVLVFPIRFSFLFKTLVKIGELVRGQPWKISEFNESETQKLLKWNSCLCTMGDVKQMTTWLGSWLCIPKT